MVAENRKTINIDLERVTFYPVLNFYQYDNNVIEFIVSKDGDFTDLGELTSVYLNFQRNDNVIISRQLTVSGNRAVYVMGEEEMALVGQANINIQLFKDDERLTAVLLRANIVKTFGVNPNTPTSATDPSNIEPGEGSSPIITSPDGEGGTLDETVLIQYLKIADAELTYRKVTDKITEDDLSEEVKEKINTSVTVQLTGGEGQETERALEQGDIETYAGSKDQFTVAGGNVSTKRVFAFADGDITAVFLPKDKKEMIFTADKKLHWIIVGADETMKKFAIFGVGMYKNFAHVSVNPFKLGIKANYTQLELDSSHTYKQGGVYKIVTDDSHVSLYYQAGDTFKLWYKVKKEVVALNDQTQMAWYSPRLGATGGISADDKVNQNLLSNVKLIEKTSGEPVSKVSLNNYATIDFVTRTVKENAGTGGGSGNRKCAVLVVAGQSNAVGYDESEVDGIFSYGMHDRAKQLGLYEPNNKKIIPLGHCAENFQDMREFFNEKSPTFKGTKGIHLPLAKLLLEKIPSDYDIVVIPAAFGGSAFTKGEDGAYDKEGMKPSNPKAVLKWSKNSAYMHAIKDRIRYVLDMNPANYYIGMVWCQGEFDADNKAGAAHGALFDEMMQDFFKTFNDDPKYKNRVKGGEWSEKQVFIFETVNYWWTDPAVKADVEAIWEYYKNWHKEGYVEIPRDTKWNTAPSTTSSGRPTSHFGYNAYYDVVAPKVYEAMVAAGAV